MDREGTRMALTCNGLILEDGEEIADEGGDEEDQGSKIAMELLLQVETSKVTPRTGECSTHRVQDRENETAVT
jgi:hypothetical protein